MQTLALAFVSTDSPMGRRVPTVEETSTLPELFLVEQQFVSLRADVIAETTGGESAQMFTSIIVCLKS
jgi:hypothetical protein